MTPSRTSAVGSRRLHDVAAWRSARGVLAGLVCGTGAVLAHTVAGGHASLAAATFVSFVAILLCLALARWALSLPRLLAVAVVVQAVSHVVFAASAASGSATTQPMSGMSGMDHYSGDMWPMWLGHAVVACLTALAARGGEQALADLARELLGRLSVLPNWTPLPAVRRRVVHVIDARLLPGTQRSVTPASKRGPPSGRVAAITLP